MITTPPKTMKTHLIPCLRLGASVLALSLVAESAADRVLGPYPADLVWPLESSRKAGKTHHGKHCTAGRAKAPNPSGLTEPDTNGLEAQSAPCTQ